MITDNIRDMSFKNITDSMPVGLFLWKIHDPNDITTCTIEYINSAASTAIQSTLDDITGKTVGEAFPGIEHTPVATAFNATMATKSNQRITDFLYGTENIPTNHFRVELVPVEEDSIVVLFMNISEQIEAEEKLYKKIEEVSKLNKFMVDRELRMVELKKQLQEKAQKDL